METKKYSLDGDWSLSFTLPEDGKRYDTQVTIPCNIEPTLVQLGLIDDYLPCDNEHVSEPFEGVDDWCYTRTFDAPQIASGSKLELVFEGIDTIAEVYLNGEKLCDCQNMHLAYRLDVTDRLLPAGNELRVIIRSSELWARKHPHDMNIVRHSQTSYYDSQAHLRKARHQWGWDNAPRLLTSGIYRSVYLEELPAIRFEEVYAYTEHINENDVWFTVSWRIETSDVSLRDYRIRLSLLDGDRVVHTDTNPLWFIQGAIRFILPRENVKLWWPAGYGEQFLYELKLELIRREECVATYAIPFGVRTVKLIRTEDILDDGTGEFCFEVNGERIFIKGTNWKPLDPLGSLADQKTKTETAMREIIALHCNMVRIWGGGIYEDHAFFDFCDRNGILVWQDFMLACEIPPNEGIFCELLKDEADAIVKKLRNHPSLAVWCGDNENDEMATWTTYESQRRPSHSRATRVVLKNAVLLHDPMRCYVESSPFVSDLNHVTRYTTKQYHQPERHLYPDILEGAAELRACRGLFLGETGPIQLNAISPNPRMLERERARAERLWDCKEELPWSDHHQNNGYFRAWRLGGKRVCEAYYGRDFDFSEWKDYLLAVNVACSEVFKDLIEYCRATRPQKTGILWWSLYDMWPMLFNYSIIDCDGVRKLPYYWIEKSQQDFALMAVRRELGGEVALYAANDTMDVHTARYTVTAYDKDCNGTLLLQGDWTQAKNSNAKIVPLTVGEVTALLIIKWEENGKTYANHFFTSREMPFDCMKAWVKIIERECEFSETPIELQ